MFDGMAKPSDSPGIVVGVVAPPFEGVTAVSLL